MTRRLVETFAVQRPPGRSDAAAALTTRESEVLALIARGRSNTDLRHRPGHTGPPPDPIHVSS